MQRPPIEKLRRIALGIALALVVVSAASYGVRAWRARQARKSVPVLASDVQQMAQGFTFSRSEAGRTLFVIQATRTVERQGRKTLLEEVSVVVYGPEGNRADEIHTGRCEYDASGAEQIFCPDPVTFDVGAVLAKAGNHLETEGHLHIETAGVRFDQASGVANTARPVTFRFPQGYGRGVGLRYQPAQPALVLEREVEIVVERAGKPWVSLRGRSLEYDSQQRIFRLRPPLELVADDRELVAGELTMRLDSAYQMERLEASGAVRARTRGGGNPWEVRSEQAWAEFKPGQGIERLRLSGQVEVEARNAGPAYSEVGQQTLTCQQAQILFDGTHQWAERVLAEGDARIRWAVLAENRELAAEKLALSMRARARAVERVSTQSRGVLTLTAANGSRRQIEADQIQMKFGSQGHLTALAAQGRVEATWQQPGRPSQRTTSPELRADFDSRGELVGAEQWGGFEFREEDRQATAGRAQFEAEREVFVLTERPVLRDARLQVSAARMELSQRDARLAASGDVRTTYAGSGATRLLGSTLPVHLVADEMQGERSQLGRSGWARYTGRARLWQGENRLEGDTIELFEMPRELVARGRVSSLLVERRTERANPSARVVRISSERFRYREAERRGLYEENVRGQGLFGTLQAAQVEVFLADSTGSDAAGLDRARASGGVVIEQPGRRAQAENADYQVASETLSLWGGEPELNDAEHGTVRGARLTFNFADDTILIESGSGSRTLTRRAWTR